MAFGVYAATQSSGSEKKSDVNWEELNQYVVDTCQLQERENLIGYVSSIVDLGIQSFEDAEYVSDVAIEDEEDYVEKNPTHYFKDGIDPEKKTPYRLKCVPQKDQQAVGISIDFPDIIVDKGQFFGESNPQPLRLWMGNQFYLPSAGVMIIGRPTSLRVTNLDKTRKTKKWSFAQNHIFYKMAVAAKLIKNGECFLPNDIDKLLGESFQFAAQVYFKENKGKSYYTEYVKFVGALGRGQSAPELLTSPFIIEFNGKNKPEHLKEIRSHVVNTMKMAKNWEGSPIQTQLDLIHNRSDKEGIEVGDDQYVIAAKVESNKQEQKEEKKPAKVTKKPAVSPEDELDDDLPF